MAYTVRLTAVTVLTWEAEGIEIDVNGVEEGTTVGGERALREGEPGLRMHCSSSCTNSCFMVLLLLPGAICCDATVSPPACRVDSGA
uniref:Uncharacterized protein n=1 Tax=Mesocestoides corti TaxID=53468 RepID=A0A5K3FX83_MESCO